MDKNYPKSCVFNLWGKFRLGSDYFFDGVVFGEAKIVRQLVDGSKEPRGNLMGWDDVGKHDERS